MTGELIHTEDARELHITSPSALPVMDAAAYQQMEKVAGAMARMSGIPKTLTHTGRKNNEEKLPDDVIAANCFRVVNQAVRWGLDPFLIIDSVALVHGRLCYEGKLVNAVLRSRGVQVRYYFTGTPGKDDRRIFVASDDLSEDQISKLKPGVKYPPIRMCDGSVADWKTTGDGSPWRPNTFDRQLIYRGTREWARLYTPEHMLGVYATDDTFENIKDVTPARPSMADRAAQMRVTGEGFGSATIDEHISGSDRSADPEPEGGDVQDVAALAQEPDQRPSHADQQADGDGDSPSTAAPSATPPLVAAAKAFFGIITNAALTPEHKSKGLVASKNRHKALVPADDHEKLQAVFRSADAVRLDKTDLTSAMEFIAEMLDVPVADITPQSMKGQADG